MKKSITLMMLLTTSSAWAGNVYVCEKDGRKEFSQLPCGENAVILKSGDESNNIKLSIPIKDKEITPLCKLVIRAKDKVAQGRKNPAQYSRYSKYNTTYHRQNNNSNDNPQAYLLQRIENIEIIAQKSPSQYQMIKNLVYSVSYQGYEESPIYQAERAAALTECENTVSQRARYDYYRN